MLRLLTAACSLPAAQLHSAAALRLVYKRATKLKHGSSLLPGFGPWLLGIAPAASSPSSGPLLAPKAVLALGQTFGVGAGGGSAT